MPRQNSFASDTEAQMSDERRAEIEAALGLAVCGTCKLRDNAYCSSAFHKLADRLRDARGDDEDDLRQWLLRAVGSASSVRSAKSVVERLVADALARSPQGEDHEAGIGDAVAAFYTVAEGEDSIDRMRRAIAAYLARVSAPKADEKQEAR